MTLQIAPHRREEILVVVAAPMTARAFLLPYLAALGQKYKVTLVCAGDDGTLQACLPLGVGFVPVDIHRAINPLADLRALLALGGLMYSGRYAMVYSVTPKAGLLAMLAARWCGVPIRLHMFTGQVWVTRRGLFRQLLKKLDGLIAACASYLLADSRSQMEFLIREGVVDAAKIAVLGNGSISGVDITRFRPDTEVRERVRSSLGYGSGDVLALFVGRLNRDKGVLDLAQAFASVSSRLPQLALLLVGPDEENIGPEIESVCGASPRLRLLGGTSSPEDYMAAADFFCLPSYREGFGSVVIEAAACGLPAIASEIYGLTDAVEEGCSGCLHPPHDVAAIAGLLERFAINAAWRRAMGDYARQRAIADFSTATVVATQIQFVDQLLSGQPSQSAGAEHSA